VILIKLLFFLLEKEFLMKSKAKVTIIFDEHGKKSGVLLSVKQYNKLMSDLEDLDDLTIALQRMGYKGKTTSLEDVRKELFGNVSKK
jgi:PHD/YefM family antitoxin component YafN of YafNO toxin-antitoxin module